MAANDFVLGYLPNLTGLLPVKNTDGANDLNPGDVCKLDASNPMGPTNQFICVVRANAATDDCVFVVRDSIPKTKQGIVFAPGPVVRVVASAAITAGVPIAAAASGQVAAQSAGQRQLGYAITPATNANDQILALLAYAKNA
jgi:hypothetical protein